MTPNVPHDASDAVLSDAPAMEPPDEHDRELVGRVHPRGFVNPEPAKRYDLVVIGAGTAGLVSAVGGAGLGARTAIVERLFLGGDCLNFGCVPSKALLRCARAYADARDGTAFGVVLDGPPRVDFAAVMERMRRIRAKISVNDSVERLRGLKIDVFLGDARFTAHDAVQVGEATLRFSRAIIATGARAAVPSIPGLSEAGYLTNESVFSLTSLPRRLAVVGAGPIGCELGQAFARFGSEVFLLEGERRILPRDDPDAAKIIEAALRRDGVSIHCGAKAASVRVDGSDRVVELDCDGERREVRADAILVAVGRAPNVEGLDLERAGVRYDRAGVSVSDHLQTTNARIYAAGDVASSYKFTHMADSLARIALQNALVLRTARASKLTVPWCTYTDPEVAHVGLSKEEAEKKGIRVATFDAPLAEVDRALLDGEDEGFLRVHLRAGSDQILGATLVSRHAGETISEITLAMTSGAGMKGLARTIHPYPTQAEAIKKAADAWSRTRLTPFVKKALAWWIGRRG